LPGKSNHRSIAASLKVGLRKGLNQISESGLRISDFMPLVIIAFRKKDGGISGCNKKKASRNRNVFLTTAINAPWV
jgi:hypothetical protein